MKHKIEFKEYGEYADYTGEYSCDAIIDGDKYEVECNATSYWVYKNGEKIKTKEFVDLLIECGYGMKFREEYDDFWTRWDYWVQFLKIKTIEGVQGPYYDPKGNEWYSAWNETHPEATK